MPGLSKESEIFGRKISFRGQAQTPESASKNALLWAMILLALVFSLISIDQLDVAQALSEEIPGLSLEQDASGKTFLSGEIHRIEDLELINELVSRSEGRIVNKSRFSRKSLNAIKKELCLIIPNLSETDLQLKKTELRYTGPSKGIFKKLQSIYSSIVWEPERQITNIVGTRNQYFIEIAFIEIRKSSLKSLGLRVGEPLEFGVHLSRNPRIDGLNPIASFLDLAQQSGDAKIHYKQSLRVREKSEGQFKVGGEYSVKLASENSSSIDKISFGIELKVKPNRRSGKKVELVLNAKIREPDLANGIEGLPLILEKSLQTTLYVPVSQTISIASLFQDAHFKRRKSLPGLGDIPLLGELFSSRAFQQNKSEAYLCLTLRPSEGV